MYMNIETILDDIGVIPEIIYYTTKDYPDGDNLSFKIGYKYHYIYDIITNKIDEMNPTLKDDEILTDLVGRVYTYIIGTEIDLNNFTLKNEECNINNIHMGKKSINYSRIGIKTWNI
jgi:hypothetical protein